VIGIRDSKDPTEGRLIVTSYVCGLTHHTNLAREQGLLAIPADIRTELLRRFHNGMLAGLSDTTSHSTRPRQRKARLLLEVLSEALIGRPWTPTVAT
jgi:hypothetical protein